MSSPTPIVLRARITEEEWAEIRKLSIDRGVRPSQLIGDALRAHLLQPKESTDAAV